MTGEWVNPFTNGVCVKDDATIAEYIRSKGGNGQPRILSRGDLIEVLACPSKFNKGAGKDDERTPSTEFGSLFDCLLTQPHKMNEYYKLAPATYATKKGEEKDWTWRSSTCREWRDAQREAGFEVCSEEDLTEAKEAIRSLMNHPEHGDQIQRLLANSRKQVFCMAEYHDKATGIVVPVKTLTDIVPAPDDPQFGKTLFDLKTAVTAEPFKWCWAVFQSDYHTQAALNLDVYSSAHPQEDRCDFRHLIVENSAPWEPAKRFLSSEFIQMGREKYLRGLKLYCECVASGEWPSYRDPSALLLADGFEACGPHAKMLAS